MNDKPDIDLFDTKWSFPGTAHIKDYFASRLHPSSNPTFTYSYDKLGNLDYSTDKKEVTLLGEQNCRMVISPPGRQLIRNSPGLLRAITNCDFDPFQGKEINAGQESKIYVIDLKGQHYVVKYYFPVKIPFNEEDAIFTPGIDQMRVMQMAEQENPVPGLRYATPVIATLDMTVSPFVENSVSLEDLQVYSFRPRRNDEGLFYDPKLASYLSVTEPEQNTDNFLIDVERMYRLFLEYKEKPGIVDDVDAFIQMVRSTLTMVELTVGSRALKEINFTLLKR